jgi:hypothetical protein
MDQHETQNTLHRLVHEIAARATIAVGLAAIGVIHLLDSIGKYSETRYLFWMYVGLMAGSVLTAGAVLFSRARLPLLVAAGLAASALIGYVLSRTTGLPHASDDVGNWTEPLGLASLFVEATVVAAALGACAILPAPSRTSARRLHAVELAEAA